MKHAPAWAIQFSALLTPHDHEKLASEIASAKPCGKLRDICEALEAITAEFPLLFVLEDLQWADHSTIDLISALGRSRTPAKLMLIATKRLVDAELPEHPLRMLKRELISHGLCHEILLQPLSEADIAEYLTSGSQEKLLPNNLAALLHRRSEGNPLFMVAALEDLIQRDFVSRQNGTWQVKVPFREIDLGVAESLRQVIEARMDRLDSHEQIVLEAASVAGVSFSSCITAPAINISAEIFDAACENLARRRQVIRAGALENCPDGSVCQTYEFVHAIYREVLYDRQTPGRRAKLHRLIGERLEAVFGTRLSEVAARLAFHFEAAADWPRAIRYLRLQAETAGRRHAPREATYMLRHALDLCSRLPESERAAPEVGILQKLA